MGMIKFNFSSGYVAFFFFFLVSVFISHVFLEIFEASIF